MSTPSDEPDAELFIDDVEGHPHVFAIRDEMTQTTPVMHEEVRVDLGPLDSEEKGTAAGSAAVPARRLPSRGRVDPDLLPLLELMPTIALSSLRRLTEVRRLAASQPSPVQHSPGIKTSEQFIPGPPRSPAVRVLVTRRAAADQTSAPALLWVHGGGFVLGRPEQNQSLMERLAAELGCVVVSVAYRLAPETPYPGPIEDCYAALRWMQEAAVEIEIDPLRIVVAGESAGAGLTASLMLLARDRQLPLPRLQALIYPMLDDRPSTSPGDPYVGRHVWTAEDNAFAWSCLLDGAALKDVSPYAAAARATDLAGLPPAYIAVGTLDLFLAENIEYAQRLLAAGVETELRVVPGAFHGFFNFDGLAPAELLQADFRRVLGRAFQD